MDLSMAIFIVHGEVGPTWRERQWKGTRAEQIVERIEWLVEQV